MYMQSPHPSLVNVLVSVMVLHKFLVTVVVRLETSMVVRAGIGTGTMMGLTVALRRLACIWSFFIVLVLTLVAEVDKFRLS